MKTGALPSVLLLMAIMLSPATLSAQSPQTPNTLRLDAAAPRPKATLADLRLLVGHWR